MEEIFVKARTGKAVARATLAIAILAILVIAGCTNTGSTQSSAPTSQGVEATVTLENADNQQQASAESSADLEIPHLHGFGFSPDGLQLVVPAMMACAFMSQENGQRRNLPAHDYMGYTPSSDGFYSSGHPHPSSGLVNPFGLIKSIDGGKTLLNLGFTGETDFHFMAVGYQNHAIYVGNPEPNSTLTAGVHYSLDDGQTWQQSALEGVTGQFIQMAIHPVDANVVALATEDGLWFSSDHGKSFTQVGPAGTVTAVTFHPSGQSLLLGYQMLSGYDLASQQLTTLPAPTIADDVAISYIAMNPVQPDEIALATFNRDIYLSQDGGDT